MQEDLLLKIRMQPQPVDVARVSLLNYPSDAVFTQSSLHRFGAG